jgi:hypothetical protein
MDKLYTFFAEKRKNEINVEEFVACMESVMQVCLAFLFLQVTEVPVTLLSLLNSVGA